MEAVREEVGSVKTAVMVVYDHDQNVTKRHSRGVEDQGLFENPWERNIRYFAFFRQHIQLLQRSENPRIVLAAATFGTNRERIVGTWAALGVAEDSILICAKFVKKSVARHQGKNHHIALLLQEHYERHPDITITQVYLLDDDIWNVQACRSYLTFISREPWNDDPRLNVPVEGLLVPAPELVMKPSMSLFVPSTEVQTHWDKCLKMEVETESVVSEWKFLQTLSTLEEKLGIESKLAQAQRSESHDIVNKSLQKPLLARRLARSFDTSAILSAPLEPLKEVVLNKSGDAWPYFNAQSNSVSEDEGTENVFDNEKHRLFQSI